MAMIFYWDMVYSTVASFLASYESYTKKKEKKRRDECKGENGYSIW